MSGRLAVVAGWFVGATMASVSLAAPALAQDDPTELTNVSLQLYSVLLDGDDQIVQDLEPGDTIPFIVDKSCYGWEITFDPVDRQLYFEESLQLPEPPASWPEDGSVVVSDDRLIGTSIVSVLGTEGTAGQEWCFAEGDPEGIYWFVISLDGAELGELNFNVQR